MDNKAINEFGFRKFQTRWITPSEIYITLHILLSLIHELLNNQRQKNDVNTSTKLFDKLRINQAIDSLNEC